MTDPAKKIPTEVEQFASKNQLSVELIPALSSFVAFLEECGQFIAKGDLKKQFTETETVKDKSGISIEVSRCLVCGHEEYEVKKES